MPYQLPCNWIETAFNGGTIEAGCKTHAFTVHRPGELELPSGRIVACDPFTFSQVLPYSVQVAPGRYAVELAVSQVSPDDQRVAFARIVFVPGALAALSMIAAGGDDPSSLDDNEILGYGVDAGTACFMSPEAGAALSERLSRDASYDDAMVGRLEQTSRSTWSWAEFRPDPGAPANVIAFSSGYGDGVYACYLGTDADGRPLCVVSDFGVVSDEVPASASAAPAPTPPPARPWWRLWA